MTKTEYREYIASHEWQQRRKALLAETGRAQGNRCWRCSMPRWVAQLAYDQDLHVHHISYANLGNESVADIEILCRRCHEVETFGHSDLRELKSRKCVTCDEVHFDPYADVCWSCINWTHSLHWLVRKDVMAAEQIFFEILHAYHMGREDAYVAERDKREAAA